MTDCPTPNKHRYATREGAETGALRSRIAVGAPLYPYACPCSWWHLTKRQPTDLPDPANTDPQRVLYIQTVPDITFRTVVVEDTTGKASDADRLALRHPANLKRWYKILGQLISDAEKQLADRAAEKTLAAHDWRRRTLGYRTSLLVRRDECKQLRANAHVDATARAARDAAHLTKADQKELRRLAGEAAIKRLIDDHPDTWAHYLAQECDRLHVELPARYLRQTA